MFSARDFPPGIMQYFAVPCLNTTGFSLCNETSVNAAVTQAMDLAVLSGHIN
jgi:hypothetical protein